MLRSISDIRGYKLAATDGDLGRVGDVFFDDRSWTVRYFVVDTAGWLASRLVLVSPVAVTDATAQQRRLHVRLSRQQVEDSPPVTTDEPFSRLIEERLAQHFDWPLYWVGPGAMGVPPPPRAAVVSNENDEIGRTVAEVEKSLRSAKEVAGYRIRASDGEVGEVHDFIADDQTWRIRYLIVDTGRILPGRKVLLSVDWIKNVNWASSCVEVDVSVESVKGAPEFDAAEPVNRALEVRLYDYYGRPKYWP
jgi:sporulation protein YlmC with PRC-barrel domain